MKFRASILPDGDGSVDPIKGAVTKLAVEHPGWELHCHVTSPGDRHSKTEKKAGVSSNAHPPITV